MELEIYSCGEFYKHTTLTSDQELFVSVGKVIHFPLNDDQDVFGPGETVHKVYGENVHICSEPLEKYEMDCPVKIESIYNSSEANENWTSYSAVIDMNIGIDEIGISFDPKFGDKYLKKIKNFEDTGDFFILSEIIEGCMEKNYVQMDLMATSQTITSDFVGDFPLYLTIS